MNTAASTHPQQQSFGVGDRISFHYLNHNKNMVIDSGVIDGVYDRRTVRVVGCGSLVDVENITDWTVRE